MSTSSPPLAAGASRRRGAGVWLALIVVLLAAATAGAVALFGGRADTIGYTTVPLERGMIAKRVDANGTVVARDTVQVGTEISGRVTRVAVDFNAAVSAGDILAELATDIYRTRVAEAEAELQLARAQLDVARSKVDQSKAEHDAARLRIESAAAEHAAAGAALGFARNEMQRRNTPGLGLAASDRDRARADLDGATADVRAADAARRTAEASAAAAAAAIETARAEIAVAAATVQQRAAALDRVRLDLSRAEIRAPMSGVVVERNVEVGQTVVASLQSPVLFTIARDIEEMRIELFVDEADIGSLREGQRVEFRVAAHPGRVFTGEIIQLRLAPMLIQNVVTYVAMLSAPNPERLLRPGMTATVRVDVEERADVPRLPNAALRFRPQREEKVEKLSGRRPGGRTGVVHVETRDGLREVAVDLGLVDDRFTEIRGGLPPGASVVTGYR